MSNTRTYKSWIMMKTRCLNPNYNLYQYYGGRGIGVCDEWLFFEPFYADMGQRPGGTTLDRIDPNGDYCKENCRWTTTQVQSENKNSSLSYELNGETKNLNEWARIAGTTRARLYNHMYKDNNFSLEYVLHKLGFLSRVTEYQTGGALVW